MTTNDDAGRLHGDALSASLTVRDIHVSVAWYRDALGFVVDREVERDGRLQAVRMRAGDVTLLLSQEDGAKGADRVKGAGFSLMITTRQSVDVVADRIKGHGTTLLAEPTDFPWGARAFRVQDPDGFAFVVSTPVP